MTARLPRLAALLVLAVVASACAGLGAPQRQVVRAEFARASNLFTGSEVRVLGLAVGEVTSVEPRGDVLLVEMAVDPERPLPADLTASVVPITLIGERVISLDPVYTGGPTFPSGDTIPVERTSSPPDVDDVLRSFENFLSALDEQALADLLSAVAGTFEGQGEGVNDLLRQGADTVEFLSEASGDLNAVVSEFAALNETLATRDERIGETIQEFSEILRTISEEKGDIIGSVEQLRRLAAELRPLLTDHTDPLVNDIEILTTTLSTVDRNLQNVADLYGASLLLTNEFGQRFADYESAYLKLDNEGQPLEGLILDRLTQRLVGLCMRLGVGDCASPEFWEPIVPALICIEGIPTCDESRVGLGEALATALQQAPPPVIDQLAQEARQRQEAEAASPAPPPQTSAAPDAGAPPPPPAPPPSSEPVLPLPDPRLDELLGGDGSSPSPSPSPEQREGPIDGLLGGG